MKQTVTILFFAGIAVFTAILGYYGASEIASALAAAGFGLALVTASHVLPLLLDSIAWRPLLFKADKIPSLLLLFKARWVGESINSLLPAAQIGGDFVRARMLVKHGVPGAVAGASVVTELTVSVITQVIFTLMGIGCLLLMGENGMAGTALAGAVILFLLAAGFVTAQRMGMWQKMVNVLAMLGGEEKFKALSVRAESLDSAVMDIYQSRRAVAVSVFWRLAGWIAGVVEVWIALHVLDAPVGFAEAFMLESLGQAVRAAAFLVPGALGIQEGGFILLGRLAGLTPEISLSLSLAKRVRELSLGIPGLIYWQLMEGAPFLNRIRTIFTRKSI